MKHSESRRNHTVYRTRQPSYPNAADDRYFAGKALDILTAIVSCLGLVSAMLFLVTLA